MKQKKNIIMIIVICILSIITAILCFTLESKPNYLSFDYKIENITSFEKGLYLTFYGDESNEQLDNNVNIKYVIYNFDVDLELLKNIKAGDDVNITVEDNFGEFKYTIIYEMKYNDSVLFNIMEDYSELGNNNKILFISFFISIIIYLLILCIIKDKARKNTIKDFIIRNPRWQRNLFFGILFGAIGFIIPFTILYILNRCDYDYFMYSMIFYLFVFIALLGIYVYIKEKFVFNNNIFTYHKAFGKTRSAHISKINKIYVMFNENSSFTRIIFYDINNKKLLWFIDDDKLLREGLFFASCKKYKLSLDYISKNIPKTKTITAKYDYNLLIENIKYAIRYIYEPTLLITTSSKAEYFVLCYNDCIKIEKDNTIIKTTIDELCDYIDFKEEITIESIFNYNISLEDQIVILKDKLWYVHRKLN